MFVPDLTPTFYGAVSTGVPGSSRWAQSLARNSNGSEVLKRLGLRVLHLNQRAGGFWCSRIRRRIRHRLAGPVRALADGERAGIQQSWFGASYGVGDPKGHGIGLNGAKEVKASTSTVPASTRTGWT